MAPGQGEHGDPLSTRSENGGVLGEGLRGRRRFERLLQAEVVDHELRVGIALGQLTGLIQPAPRRADLPAQSVVRQSREGD